MFNERAKDPAFMHLAGARTACTEPAGEAIPPRNGEQEPEARRAVESGQASVWDAATDIPYASFDQSKYSKEQLDAGRLCWSRRAWTEYTGIVESPALCIRLCLEGQQSIEMKFGWRPRDSRRRATPKPRSCWQMRWAEDAEEPPPGDAIMKMLVAGFRDRMGFNPEVPVEAAVAGWHCVSEGIALETFLARYEWTTEPVTREVIRLIAQDEMRHVEMGWAYLEQRTKELNRGQVAEIEAVARVM